MSRTQAPNATLAEPDLREWGERVGRAAGRDEVFVALYGPLGAGKSTLVRAACRGLDVEGAVPSPTFTLVNVHQGSRGPIRHVDLYRLDPPVAEETLVRMGWPDVLEAEGAVFVEWADRAGEWLPADRWDIRLERSGDPDVRRVSIDRRGNAPEPPGLP